MALRQVWRTLTRQQASHYAVAGLCQQTRDVITQLGLRRRGCRAGKHHRRRVEAARLVTSLTVSGNPALPGTVPVIAGNRLTVDRVTRRQDRQPVRTVIRRCSTTSSHAVATTATNRALPTLYVLNAASIAKPHAIQHLSADLVSYDVHIAVITETHLKQRHADHFADITGYSLFRRDRAGRKGGGVAVYVNSQLSATVWTCPSDSPLFELLWVCVCAGARDVIVGALYHPPQPLYQTSDLLNHIEVCVDTIASAFPAALVVLAGDFNTLPEDDVVARTALCSIVDQPTRGTNKLDRIYVSEPDYTSIKVVTSTGKTDHKAVIAYTGSPLKTANKSRTQLTFRRRSPNQHALFLSHLSSLDITFDTSNPVRTNFDQLYKLLLCLLDRFYPQRKITITSTDPYFITPTVKSQLRRKNRLLRAGRVEEAEALAKQIRGAIIRQNTLQLRRVNTRQCAKQAWEKVRQFTSRGKGGFQPPPGLTAQLLNSHYAAVSADSKYTVPPVKQTAAITGSFVTEMEVFRMLDRLKPTATGLDMLPAWFLRLSAPVIAAPLTQLFNQSIRCAVVPQQWKAACISPIPKVAHPAEASDYRPISITSVLSRMLERHIVRTYVYPALHQPPPGLHFADQFAFRPTGSTEAALITLSHTIFQMLSTQPFVRVFALDFSKAFDSVRHSTLLEKMARLALPDAIYNWMISFFSGHSHCTKFNGNTSELKNILASVIQGSAIGPASFIVTASDLQPVHAGNALIKFADDTYVIVPADNSDTSTSELMNVKSWSEENNLKLNCTKSKEIVFTGRGARNKSVTLPPPCLGICQVRSITALGVVLNDKLTATDHVSSLLTSCSSSLYAMRVLRDHGLPASSLQDVFRATVIAKLTYCAPAWSGFCSASDRARLDAFLRRTKRYGYCSADITTISDLFSAADESLFKRVLHDDLHVLQPLLPAKTSSSYNLRPRRHNRQLPRKSAYVNDSCFITRMLHSNSY